MKFWNEETAPHYQGNNHEVNSARVNKPISRSKSKFVEWSTLSVIIWISFGILVVLVSGVTNVTDANIPNGDSLPLSYFQELAAQLPLLGDLIAFDLFPGTTALGTVSYLVGAIPLAIGVRNLLFVFEHIGDYQYTEDENIIQNLLLVHIVLIAAIIVLITMLAIAAILDHILL